MAGFDPPPPAAARDAQNLALLERLSKRGPRFVVEVLAGSELLLRAHWAGVERLAAWLRDCGTIGPTGLGLVRMALETPPRPLVPDIDTFVRLIQDLENVPELKAQLVAALGSRSTAQ
jgi:hypothetical protein